jgi:hypothetical protein
MQRFTISRGLVRPDVLSYITSTNPLLVEEVEKQLAKL